MTPHNKERWARTNITHGPEGSFDTAINGATRANAG